MAACTETSKAEVGSSQTSTRGAAGEGPGDGDSLLQTSRELIGTKRQMALLHPDGPCQRRGAFSSALSPGKPASFVSAPRDDAGARCGAG